MTRREKWKVVLLVALAESLAMSLWFSASAVTPALAQQWHLDSGQVAWLTMTVQVGFVFGALLSALTNFADLFRPRWIIALGAAAGAAMNALIPLAGDSVAVVMALRFFTGAALALVYPVGMKLIATWMKDDRGLGIGLLVGALTLGSASPHLIRALVGEISQWREVVLSASGLAAAGAVLVALFGESGPYAMPTPKFNWKYVAEAFRLRGVRLANFGYFGHMWELYAVWTWIPAYLLASFEARGSDGMAGDAAQWAAVVGFLTIAAGAPGSLAAGYLADRWGRTRTTLASLAISGACSLGIGFLFGASPLLLSAVALVWGFAVVADSAQFSASVSELCTKEYTGTALTVQTSVGFLITMVSIRLVPMFAEQFGWRWVFLVLAVGPLFGAISMWRLMRSPEAAQLAGGRG